MKKALSLILALVLLIGLMPLQAFATEGTKETEVVVEPTETTETPEEETAANGTCGDALAWTLDENGVLTISGTGKMYDYGYRPAEERVVMPPWNAHKNDITTVVMEDGITHIGQMAFEGCSNLTGIELSEDLTAIGNNAFSNCSSLANVRLPETLTSMGNFAFSGCKSLTNMEIPAGVTTIGTHAFSNCSALVEIDLPDGITQISERMFNDCAALASIEIPTGITGIGDYAFFGCKSLETVELPDGVVSIGESAFDNCANLASVKLPDSLTGIGNNAFSACSSLTAIELPATLTSISDYVFFSCHSLTSIQIPEGVTAIGDWAFYGCGLTDINLPDSVTTIGKYAYYSCDYLTAIALPDSVTTIGDHAFCDCIRLTSIKLPAGLISIGNTVFEMCKSLEKITFTGDAPTIAESAFADVTATAYYPSNNATWSAMARQNYGATALTWTSYSEVCKHTYENGVCTGCGEAQPGPVITQQAESVQQEIGKKFAITVKAEGEGLTYQWYYKDAGMKNFGVSSNKTSSYAYTMQSYMNGRQVYCVVTDAYGNQATTETATITLPPVAVTITQQPQDARVNVGEKFSISPKVEGEGLAYQWYYKDAGMKKFGVSSNKTSSYAYTMQSYMIGRQVYCVITDKHGNTVTTDVATISLPAVELKILTQPEDVYAALGEKYSIAPEVQGEGLTYQWYYKESYQKNFSVSSNKTSAYAYTMQSYMNGRSVYCIITDQYGNQVTTETVTIHVTK